MPRNLQIPYPKQIFVFGPDTSLGEKVAKHLETDCSNFEIRNFPDGERIPHQMETVRDRDVYLILTSLNHLNQPQMDKWMIDYLRFIYSLRAGQPHRITVVIPKLPHQRQDVENRELRQPKMSDLFPKLALSAGASKFIVCRLHNPASSYGDMENISTTHLFINKIKSEIKMGRKVAIGAGDMGGSKYARKVAEQLGGLPVIICDKDRDIRTGKTKTTNVFTHGDLSDNINTLIFIDDLISTFGTMKDGADAVYDKYPHINRYIACATHADFGVLTYENMNNSRFSEIWVTDTVPVNSDFLEPGSNFDLVTIPVDKLIARAIDNLHNGESVSALWIKNGSIEEAVVVGNSSQIHFMDPRDSC